MEVTGDAFYVIMCAVGIGLVVGFLQTVVGLGGGVAMVPLLPLAFGVDPRQAVATSIATMAPVAVINSIRVILRKEMIIRRSVSLGIFSALGSAFAAHATGWFDPVVLKISFGLVVGWMGVQTLWKPAHVKYDLGFGFDPPVGILAGLVSGFTGVSGGVVLSPYINRLKSIDSHKAIPTGLGAIALGAISGAFVYTLESFGVLQGRAGVSINLIQFHLVPLLVLGALTSSYFGIRHQGKIPPRVRLAGLGILLIGLCVQTLVQTLLNR